MTTLILAGQLQQQQQKLHKILFHFHSLSKHKITHNSIVFGIYLLITLKVLWIATLPDVWIHCVVEWVMCLFIVLVVAAVAVAAAAAVLLWWPCVCVCMRVFLFILSICHSFNAQSMPDYFSFNQNHTHTHPLIKHFALIGTFFFHFHFILMHRFSAIHFDMLEHIQKRVWRRERERRNHF